jgi:hypothetical protein
MTEKQIQNYIWEQKDSLADLILDIDFPDEIKIENPSHLTPSQVIYNKIITDLKEIYNSVYELNLFGYEVPLKKDSASTIRADLLGLLAGRNGLAVIEIKKSNQTERQAYTELLAYGGHLRTVFAPMSKMDIAYILITPMEERIVREATIISMIYERNTTIALIPVWQNDDVTTLKLKPWFPTLDEIDSLSNAVFSEKNFDVFKITWDALEGEWSPEKEGDDPDEDMIKKMNTVSSYAAQTMEAKGIHGFVFASQTWSELRKVGNLINAIVLVGLNPYKATKNRYLVNQQGLKVGEANNVDIEQINLLDIIPELANSASEENMEFNYLSDLSMSWSNEITRIGFDIVGAMTKNLDSSYIEKSYGSFEWDKYQFNMLEDIHCQNFDFKPTGLIRDLFIGYSQLDFDFIRENGTDDHIQYSHGDIPKYLVDISHHQYYMREFIRRLFNPYHEFLDDDELE